MQDFLFYIDLGLHHVLNPSALDHLLFLCALALPFNFKYWKKVLVLATVFTTTHCLSLALSVYGVAHLDIALVEFLIPVTILFTAIINIWRSGTTAVNKGWWLQVSATAFFGLIHGLGFSNYFNMLMAGEDSKAVPLLGFAGGIEISQVLIIFAVLLLSYAGVNMAGVKSRTFVIAASAVIAMCTIPMLVRAFPW